MSKINEILHVIQAGSRANKYQVMYPIFGDEIDIVCHATSSPGREIVPVDVFVKGRKIQYAGESTDEGTWSMTIYNTPDLLHRRFFLKMIGGIHSFNTPGYITDNGGLDASDISGSNSISVEGSARNGGAISGLIGNISSSISKINTAYNDVKNALSSIQKTGNFIKQAINGDFTAVQTLLGSAGYGRPWYMQEIVINQLGENGEITASTTLHNCFVTGVGPIEYSDESAEITTSEITFAYSGISYGNNAEIDVIEKY